MKKNILFFLIIFNLFVFAYLLCANLNKVNNTFNWSDLTPRQRVAWITENSNSLIGLNEKFLVQLIGKPNSKTHTQEVTYYIYGYFKDNATEILITYELGKEIYNENFIITIHKQKVTDIFFE